MYLPEGVAYPVSPTETPQILNAIDGNHIVWAEPRYGNYDIFMATFSVGEDNTAPTTTVTIKPAPNSDGWNQTAVTVALKGADTGGSGVKATYYTLDGGATQIDPIGGISVTSEGEHATTYWSVDYAGNVEATQEVTIRIDKTAPTISLTSPEDGATYFYQQQVAAAYSATDTVSGIASVSGTTANGSPIETSSLGARTFTVNATDHAGNAASTSVTYTVKLPASTVTLQPPLNGSAPTVVKSGRSLPITDFVIWK